MKKASGLMTLILILSLMLSAVSFAESDWDAANISDGSQTTDELYELAKGEGKVVIYSISSRMDKAMASFSELYPGIEVEVYNMKTDMIKEKVMAEYNSGVKGADLVHVTDLDGMLFNEYVANDILDIYYPDDIVAKIDTDTYSLVSGFPMYYELTQWFYNDELCPEGVDVDSWWDLTRPEWKGKLIMNDLLTNHDYIAQFAAFAEFSDEFEADYQREFGEPIRYTNPAGKENAAYELVYRLIRNDIVFTQTSDEAVESVGAEGTTEVKLAWGPSSKIRNNVNKGWHLAALTTTPRVGVPKPNNLYIVDECKHPNAAKLALRYLLGGDDGNGRGKDQFNTMGGWFLRRDVLPEEGSTPLSDIPLWPNDPEFVYYEVLDMEDFILSLIG